MNIEDFTPVSPERIEGIRWKGEQAYRVLSHSFSVRWSGDLTGDEAHYVFGSFAVRSKSVAESGNGSSVYSLVDLGPDDRRRFRLVLGEGQLISSPNAQDVEHHLLFQILTQVQKQNNEFLLIHAGAVVTPEGEGVLLPASPGHGKTTLVAGLIRAGFGFLSDEIGVIDYRSGTLRPHARALNFKEGGLATFPDLQTTNSVRRHWFLRAEEIRPDVVSAPSKLRYVIAPRYQEASATHVSPLSTAATVKELWSHTVNFSAHADQVLPLLVGLARQSVGYRIVSGNLAEAVRTVKDLTGRRGVYDR